MLRTAAHSLQACALLQTLCFVNMLLAVDHLLCMPLPSPSTCTQTLTLQAPLQQVWPVPHALPLQAVQGPAVCIGCQLSTVVLPIAGSTYNI